MTSFQRSSDTARYLIMERLDDITVADYPLVPAVPDWLNDRKPSAFGKAADGTIKVCDYGMLELGAALVAARTDCPPFALTGPLGALTDRLMATSDSGFCDSGAHSKGIAQETRESWRLPMSRYNKFWRKSAETVFSTMV
jgi:hypothetical protein